MDLLRTFFPISFRSYTKDNFIVALVIYIIADVAAGITSVVLGSVLGAIPIIGMTVTLTCSLIGLYATAGIVLSILVFTKVIK